MNHLPILQVLLPLLGAPLCALTRRRLVAWSLFLAAAAGATVCALLLSYQVARSGPVRYALGGWPAPAGIEYLVDAANAPVLALVSTIALVVAGYARSSVQAEIDDRRIPFFYSCLCLCLAGLLGVTATADAFNAFVFLEISSLSSYALIAMGRRRRALLAAFRYLVIGTIGATFLLIGIGLAYAVTGTLNMADLAARLPEFYGNRALTAAVAFVFVGLGVKMAAFPLHAWLPDAYAQAPSAVSTFLAAVSTKVAIYAFLRFAFGVFGGALVFGLLPVGVVGLVVGTLAMLVAGAVACFQRDLKYLLAWSSVAQLGYIIAGVSLATRAGVAAGYLHLINHAVTKAALFAAAGVLLLRLGSVQLSALAGLGRRMPWTFTAILLAGLGLIGVPPTAGFVSKWALVLALAETGRWLVLAAVLLSSLLAVVYVGRVIEIGWFREPVGPPDPAPPARTMIGATWVLVAVSLYFGVAPGLPAGLADAAAAALLGGAR
ncbi:MAG: monovalent cation/H+ antiporter subunit D family protein [Pseudonocardia sp.]